MTTRNMFRSRAARRLPAALVLSIGFLGLVGCAEEFDPPTYLQNARVLAIEASVLDVVGDEEVTLTPVVWTPPELLITEHRWRFCSMTQGAQSGYECIAPECEVELPAGPDGTLTTRPMQHAMACLAAVNASGALDGLMGGGDGDAAAASDQRFEDIETVFFYELETDDGFVRRSILRLPLWVEGEPETENGHPAVAAVLVDGEELQEGQRLPPLPEGEKMEFTARVDPASLDTFVDAAGDEQLEEAIWYYFSTAGRMGSEAGNGDEVEFEFEAKELEEGQTEAEIYILAVDLRGGQTVVGPYIVPLVPEE